MDTFADRLRFARQQRKLSQNALARASGLSQGAISSYETGHRKSTKEIFRLAQVLKVNATWLSLGSGPMDLHLQAVIPTTPTEPAHRLSDKIFPSTSGHWPFQQLNEADYWSLTDKQRRMVDHMAATLVKHLQTS